MLRSIRYRFQVLQTQLRRPETIRWSTVQCLTQEKCYSTSKNGKKKRRVAIVAGYVGSDFYGVQLNPNVPTIEDEIRKAMLKNGAITSSNFESLSKINWSRSSRTDKGVHANSIVFSGKLLIDENAVEYNSGRVLGLTEALNGYLPPSIRIFSCTRVYNRFDARSSCALREYEYLLPLSFLSASLVVPQQMPMEGRLSTVVERFLSALQQYEGIHDFHNFTRSRSHFYKLHQRKHSASVEAASDDHNEETELENDADVEPAESNAKQRTRPSLPRHRRSIYACRGSVVQDFYGKPFLRLRIVGQAFLLHQIRCLVGGALSVATGGMSSTVFDAALYTDHIVRIPIAPAEGLILRCNAFAGKRHLVSLNQDWNTIFASDKTESPHRILLNEDEALSVRIFRENVIYPRVIRDWDRLRTSESVCNAWRKYLRVNLMSNFETLALDTLQVALDKSREDRASFKQRQNKFVHANRLQWIHDKDCRREFLPRQFTTQLCMRYVISPGPFAVHLQNGVVQHLKQNKIHLEATMEEIMAYIDQYGPMRLAEEGKDGPKSDADEVLLTA